MSDLLPVRASFVATAPDGAVSETDLAAINHAVSKPFTPADLYVFACVMCTSDLTDYATRMGASSLQNFSRQAQSGTPYLLDHNPYGGTYGYTYAGQYAADANEARAAVYIPKGRNPGGRDGKSSNQEIADIQAGMRRAVSVGFGGPMTEFRCDVCGNDVFSMDCPHIPGMKLDGKLVTATVENARLLEVSGAWQGACPGAIIGKAQEQYEAKRLSVKEFRGWLNQMSVPDPTRYISPPPSKDKPTEIQAAPANGAALTLPGHSAQATPSPSDQGAGTPRLHTGAREDNSMRDKLIRALTAFRLNRMAVAVVGTDSDEPDALAATMAEKVEEEVKDRLEKHPLMQACYAAGIESPDSISKTLDRAKLGDEYLAELRDDAQREAVRAYGADNGQKIGAQVANLSALHVKTLRDSWRIEANTKFGIGEDGKAPARLSAAGALPTAKDVDKPDDSQKSAWEKLTPAQRDHAEKMGMKTPEQREKFAVNLVGAGANGTGEDK